MGKKWKKTKSNDYINYIKADGILQKQKEMQNQVADFQIKHLKITVLSKIYCTNRIRQV